MANESDQQEGRRRHGIDNSQIHLYEYKKVKQQPSIENIKRCKQLKK